MSKATNNENDAFEKMLAGLRHAQEGAAELAIFRSDADFMRVSTAIQAMGEKIKALAAAGSVRRKLLVG